MAWWQKGLTSLKIFINGTACFCIFIDYRGHHRKGVAIYMPLESIYNKNLGFVEQKMYF
jgi:hypothetical protein